LKIVPELSIEIFILEKTMRNAIAYLGRTCTTNFDHVG